MLSRATGALLGYDTRVELFPYTGDPTPWEDPLAAEIDHLARSQGADLFLGNHPPGRMTLRARAAAVGLDLDLPRSPGKPPTRRGQPPSPPMGWEFFPGASIDLGNRVPENAGGWQAPGLGSVSLLPGAAVYVGDFQARLTPRLALGISPSITPELRFSDAWVGVDTGTARLGFGKEQRWIGPGRFGTLMYSDNAVAPWMGTVSGEGRLPGKASVIGRFRGEVGIGVMDRPRRDVEMPALMMMDVRYLPIPQVEIGATRMTLFGGEGRPPVDLGELLIPSEPHLSGDPDLLLPDQDEMARIDLRVTLPLAKWWKGPVDYVEAWWEYGGEDVIKKEVVGIPYPSLAGVANIFGGEVGVGPLAVNAEYARLMDDRFRWYWGHRVYHDGFTQELREIGHFGGPDSETVLASAAWNAPNWRLRLLGGTTRKVGVIETLNDHVFAFLVEEHGFRLGAEGGLALPQGGYLQAGYTYEHIANLDFVPGDDQDFHGLTVGVAPGRRWTSH